MLPAEEPVLKSTFEEAQAGTELHTHTNRDFFSAEICLHLSGGRLSAADIHG